MSPTKGEGRPAFPRTLPEYDGMGAEIAGRIGEEANARLIAAAPEMAALLARLVASDPESTCIDHPGAETCPACIARDAAALLARLDAEGTRS